MHKEWLVRIGIFLSMISLLTANTPMVAAEDPGGAESCNELPDNQQDSCNALMQLIPICEGEPDLVECIRNLVDVCPVHGWREYSSAQLPIIAHPNGGPGEYGVLIGPIVDPGESQYTYYFVGIDTGGNCPF